MGIISSVRHRRRMVKGAHRLANLLADEYSGKILSLTYSQPRSVQEICAISGIPIAVAYRRVAELESAGMVGVDRMELSPNGKKSKFYACRLDMARLTFTEGRFEVEVEWRDTSKEKVPLTVETS